MGESAEESRAAAEQGAALHPESEPLVELLGQAERLRKIRDLGGITREQYSELLKQLLARL